MLENLAEHKSEPVRRWLADPRRRRRHLHLTPTSAFWLNLIEVWFSVLTRKAPRAALMRIQVTRSPGSLTGSRSIHRSHEWDRTIRRAPHRRPR